MCMLRVHASGLMRWSPAVGALRKETVSSFIFKQECFCAASQKDRIGLSGWEGHHDKLADQPMLSRYAMNTICSGSSFASLQTFPSKEAVVAAQSFEVQERVV